MLKKLLTGLLLLVAMSATEVAAANASLSFARPTQYTDGTALPPSEIASYNVRCASFTPTGGTSGACPTITPTTLPGTATGGTITLTIPSRGGAACFQVQTVAVSGATSDWSAQACKTFAPLTPNPPSNVTVAVVVGFNVSPVYSVTSSGARSTFMGFAELGKACGSSVLFRYRGAEFREVQRADVGLWGSTTLRLAAACGQNSGAA